MLRRPDILELWRSRGLISQREFEAGRRFERLYERSQLNGHPALDFERVPGAGLAREMPAETVLQARQQLRIFGDRLGDTDFALISRVIGQGLGLDQTKKEDRLYYGRRVREALLLMSALVLLEPA